MADLKVLSYLLNIKYIY